MNDETRSQIQAPRIKPLEIIDYESCRQAMKAFTDARSPDTRDEIWLVEHPPVYTLGLAGKLEHILNAGDIPVVRTERGGQVTYHGPGQVIAYTLIDIARRRLTIRDFVCRLEQAIIDLLEGWKIKALRKPGAPGVYVDQGGRAGAKIASLGLKVSRGRTYHGIALNVDMDLGPFAGINPCGMAGLDVVDLAKYDIVVSPADAAQALALAISDALDPSSNQEQP